MGKAPAFQFYPNDYIRDTRMLSLTARGAWADLLCFMWYSDDRGNITGDITQFSRLFGVSIDETKGVIEELKTSKVCNILTDSNGIITITNRRMVREESERKSNRYRQQKYYDKHKNEKPNADITPPSSTSSSSSIKKKYNTKPKFPDGKPPQDFLEKIKTNPAYKHINIDTELAKMDAWLLLPKNKRRKKTPSFVLNWLNKIEAPVNGTAQKIVIGLSEQEEARIREIEEAQNG